MKFSDLGHAKAQNDEKFMDFEWNATVYPS